MEYIPQKVAICSIQTVCPCSFMYTNGEKKKLDDAGRQTAYTPYTYVYIYKCSTLEFFDNIFIEDVMPEKALKYALFQKI